MNPQAFDSILGRLVNFYDRCSSEVQRRRIERWTLWLAVSGFLIHLTLIALVRAVPSLRVGVLTELDRNYLHAVYTPFSFILFYEVLLLVFAIPKSHTSSIAMQYEILSLIVIRRVFKDIGEFRDPALWFEQTDAAWAVLLDMIGALVMFGLIVIFRRVRRTVRHSAENSNLAQFVAIKKSVALVLYGILLTLAIYNVLQWLIGVFGPSSGTGHGEKNLDYFFFPMFFEFMIFTDIFLLIVSIPFFERYDYVVRNAGFVISTVLLRFSLSTPKPYDLLVGLTAILYGLGVLSVFSYSSQVQAHREDGAG
ncbi:MAG: hypothetical protein LW720_03925 [Pirellula sp.]|jgi:hypothetical protein|nr:hypothetical protein [Pirellula sp.]